ncbi:MAG: acyl-homoserine-lactone synthase [Rhodospirillales bacterium]|jgi:N-acyl-L-homoserine lactone synthetase|nr:acyl-homoserine-lactone synthase [Rhodospirillales bacterium]
MITILSKDNFGTRITSLEKMHRLRKEVFNDRLGWSVAISGDLEVDEYDALSPVYVLSETAEGDVLGVVRLLPTIGPYMLRDTFASLLDDGQAPASELLWEASRFAVARNGAKGEGGLAHATYELLIGVLRFSLANEIEAIVCVVDLRMERVLRRAGWHMQRLGADRRIGCTMAVAGRLDVSEDLLRQLEGLAEESCAAAATRPATRIRDLGDASAWETRPLPSYAAIPPRPNSIAATQAL